MSSRPTRVLLVKPFQPVRQPLCQPPLGILYLASSLRAHFGHEIDVSIHDMRLFRDDADTFADEIVATGFDIVGFSALNFEAEVSQRMAARIKAAAPETILALGGPYAHSSPERIRASAAFDWIFDGEAERTFARTIEAWRAGNEDEMRAIPGLTWRKHRNGAYHINGGTDSIQDLDSLPYPAWDLVPFATYAKRPNMNGWLRGRAYAPIFTSRGCPYKCNYCHDIFGKKYRWRSVENVVNEIALLHERYGIDEFQIIDDIFNLHKPRMREIARAIIARFGARRLHFCFPNGVRADILDPEDLPLLRDMGVYQIAVAIETVTPRLQAMVEKHLNIDRVREVVAACAQVGIYTKGFFMLGFPTETREEIEATIQFALDSQLTFAGFYLVVPQEGTPIHALAKREAPEALRQITRKDFYSERSWYQLAYGINLRRIQRVAFRRFFLHPRRAWRIARAVSASSLLTGFVAFLRIATRMDPVLEGIAWMDKLRFRWPHRALRWSKAGINTG